MDDRGQSFIIVRRHDSVMEERLAVTGHLSTTHASKNKGLAPSAMHLPQRNMNQEDRLPLERAMLALEDAKKSLELFSATTSVESNSDLAEAAASMRQKLKKLRSRGRKLTALWSRPAPASSG
jgi:hypothetical protein